MLLPAFRSRARRSTKSSSALTRHVVAPAVEALEERCVPSATMVTQLNQATASTEFTGAVAYKGALYFTTTDPQTDNVGLYKSDGTAAGTGRVKVLPGVITDPPEMTVANGFLYFLDGYELWRSDGTDPGTIPLKGGVQPETQSPGWPRNTGSFLTSFNGSLYFTAYESATNTDALWQTDGTAAGTVAVNLAAGGTGGLTNVSGLTVANGALYFQAQEAGSPGKPYGLWKSDGTAAGTSLVLSGYVSEISPVSGALVFEYYNPGVTGSESLWRTDGTAAGTYSLKGLLATSVTAANGKVYFVSHTGAGTQLFVTDGTLNGTVPLALIGTNDPRYYVYTPDVTTYNGAVYFAADDGVHGTELWKTDGTYKGTVMVKDINPGPQGSQPRVDGFEYTPSYHLTVSGGTLYFSADDGVHGSQLWKTDGTAAGTVMVKDINPGLTTANTDDPEFGLPPGSSLPSLLTDVNGALFFTADDGTHGTELWVSNGTAAGTRLVTDLTTTVTGASPYDLVSVNGTVYFAANDGVHGTELWKSDRTTAGAVMVKDINPGPTGSEPFELTNVNGTLFFLANDGTHGWQLWKSDGTAAGTIMVKDIGTSPLGVDVPAALQDDPPLFINVNGLLFFTANIGGTEGLWRSDGTAAGTFQVADLTYTSLDQLSAASVNGTLFFSMNDGNGYELWKSDGTVSGTVMVKDLEPGPEGAYPKELTNLNGTLYFTAYDLGLGLPPLLKSDGTAAGTVTVAVVPVGGLTNINGTLYFSGIYDLWKSDGTAAGTTEISLIQGREPFVRSSPPGWPTFVGAGRETFFLVGNIGVGYPTQLWETNGTSAGTQEVASFDGQLSGLTASNGMVYFLVQDSVHGSRLWQSVGTAAGTKMVIDIDATPTVNWPLSLADANGTLFFTANDGVHGQQLWKVGGATTTPPLSASGKAISVPEGQTFSGTVATFADPGPAAAASTYTALITWGDGQTSPGTITALGGGKFSVSGSHVYAHSGGYGVRVQITGANGSAGTATASATVAEEPFWAGRTFQRVKEGQAVAGLLGSLTDLNLAAAAGDFTVTIDWGDGSTSTGLVLPQGNGKFDIGGTHAYASTGLKTLTMTIKDEAGRTVTVHPLIAVDI